ncbi:hypothetical protein [Ruegeria jejuensis]|uniref:hypothetical protein n=1 Tax=Ruegeria jejuensis TaxID=3233338 RepID=UPI00355B2C99
MTVVSGQLDLVRGTVTSRSDTLDSVRVDRKTGYGKINKILELWLRDASGTEHRYQGNLFEAARAGHDVAVVVRKSSGKPVAFVNLTTGVVHEDRELTVKTTVQARLFDTFWFSLLGALPGLFVWYALLDVVGLSDSAFSAVGLQIYILVLSVSVFSGLTVWSKGYADRTEKLRHEIDSLIEQSQRAAMLET